MPTDRFGKCGERRRFKPLRQCLFSNCPADTTIAVLKGMDRFKPQMPDSRARDCRQRLCPCGRTVVEPCDKRLHLSRHAVRWRRFIMNARRMKITRHDLHRIDVSAVATEISEIAPAVDRTGGVEGRSVAVRVNGGGRRSNKKK